MIRFNVIGTGFLDMQEGALSFTTENQWFRFCDVSLGRSVEFSIPANDTNRRLLGYGADPAWYGDMLRRSLDCQMVYDGGVVDGTLNVTGYAGDSFRCVFLLENAGWLNDLQGRKLADCVTSFDKGVLWSQLNTPVHADEADFSQGVQIVQYDNGVAVEPANWQLMPSVNVFAYIDDILTNMGVPHSLTIPKELWLVSASLKGGTSEVVTMASTGTDSATVSTTSYLTVVHEDLEWARANVFGLLVGGGSQQAAMFKAEKNLNVTLPASFPWGVSVIKWDSRLMSCEIIGNGDEGNGLAGRTLEIKKGTTFFFATHVFYDMDASGTYFGWKDTAQPYSFTVTIERGDDLQYGEVWQLRNNAPDMTVFEFLKSVALATGTELSVTSSGIVMGAASDGTAFKSVDRVVSVEEVTRRVPAWGDSTKTASIVFDSEEYVTARIRADFDIDNDQLTESKETKVGFSEGEQGNVGVLIRDVDATATPPKLVAKKWTIAKAVTGETNLQRVDIPAPVGYDDIADNSTCLKVKMMAGEADFFALRPHLVWLWRGMAYLWTDAQWSDGVLSLTLQKVSKYPTTPS